MKFLYSDSLDFVDPGFDFSETRSQARRAHADDQFPHEFLNKAPYDGLLVSRGIVGNERRGGKYSGSQFMRFAREGARSFLRFPLSAYPNSMIMGDNGAFTYRTAERPPYGVDETLEFYEDAEFTHGCSIDHIIFDFLDDDAPAPEYARRRFDITLELASDFERASRPLRPTFTPVGVIQGWSAASMARAAADLARMGYDYLAVGGLVPLRIDQIHRALGAIRDAIPAHVKLHLLGFGKTEHLRAIRRHGIASFDTTSPLLRAFKDANRNYYSVSPSGDLEYFMAIRIPHATESRKLQRAARIGMDQERLIRLEEQALSEIRLVPKGRTSVESAVEAALAYARYAKWDNRMSAARAEAKLRREYTRTLRARPWERCACRVCSESGIEALIFRSSNRNKRRGMHNLEIFYTHLQTSREPSRLGIAA